MTDPNRFINMIEEARIRAGLTQAELSTRAGCRQQNYSARGGDLQARRHDQNAGRAG